MPPAIAIPFAPAFTVPPESSTSPVVTPPAVERTPITAPCTVPPLIFTTFGFDCAAPEVCVILSPMPPYALPVSRTLFRTRVLPVTAAFVVTVPPAEIVPFTTGILPDPEVPTVSVLPVTEPFIRFVPTMSPYGFVVVPSPVSPVCAPPVPTLAFSAAYAAGAAENAPPTASATNAASCRRAFIPLSISSSPPQYIGKNPSLQRHALRSSAMKFSHLFII